MCIYLSFVFVGCAAVPAEADLGGASPAASRRRALLRSAGMLGVNGQVWLIPSRCALGRSYKTSWATAVTTRARSVRDKSEAWMNIASSPALRSNAICRAAAGLRNTRQKPRTGEQVKHQKKYPIPGLPTQPSLVLSRAPEKERLRYPPLSGQNETLRPARQLPGTLSRPRTKRRLSVIAWPAGGSARA